MTGLLIFLDIMFIAVFGFNLYWQSQIIVPAKYKSSCLILAAIFAVWILSGPINSWAYIIMAAAFLTVTLMQGTGGIGAKRLVTNGFFATLINYKSISHVTLIPVQVLHAKPQVISIFTTINRQNIQMTFNRSVDELKQELRQVIPQNIEIEVSQL
ncbi:hypothetical protein DS830_08105 [Bombilactobacillus bombi]|uniref:Uncharacterized protein n=1 Tax=Bombilactobacillus bombi TaxID=1303590 RepID=A0A347STU3_9LACO|nr:hypothetical protein [Bombilactobacillus bombi]AXX65452.1 hypothetical protein DS830_08105 [Bombilactobacillus bombi]RHW48661.1 hypothetical protein DS832_00915 [Bombilactobacillus bombi]